MFDKINVYYKGLKCPFWLTSTLKSTVPPMLGMEPGTMSQWAYNVSS